MDLYRPTATGDLPEAYAARLAMDHLRTTRYIGLSVARASNAEGTWQTETYRLHTLDLATRRILPVLLGVTDGGCDHDTCSLMTLDSLAAEYARESGWSAAHAGERALQLVLGLGEDDDL